MTVAGMGLADSENGRDRLDAAGLPAFGALGSAARAVVDTVAHDAALAPPGDPLFANQWHLNAINVLTAWDDYTGAGVAVAVYDQGIDRLHVDLDGNFSSLSVNASNLGAGGAPAGFNDNHGTAVAGIIAAERNDIGVVGIAYNADLVAIYDPLTFTSVRNNADNAFNYAAETADVMNNSWGFGNAFFNTANSAFNDNFRDPVFQTAGAAVANAGMNGRDGLGTVIVQSAGNSRDVGDDTNLHNFQNNRFTVTVAATLQDGNLAPYSTRGASILVAAPGSGIPGSVMTTDRSGGSGYTSNDYMPAFNGTSAAAPMVAGVVALMLEANSGLGNRDVQEILAYSAWQTGPGASYQFNGAHNWNGGGLHTSADFGFGLVDATAAVRLAESWPYQRSYRDNEGVSQNFNVNQAIPDVNATGTSFSFSIPGNANSRLDRIEIDLNVTHTWIGDLIVTLTSPSGTVSTLVNRPGATPTRFFGSSQADIHFVLDSTQFWGEQDRLGTWTITVADVVGGLVGTFDSFTYTVYSDATADDLYVYTDEFASLGVGPRATLTDANGGADWLNAAAVTSDSTIDLRPGETSTIAGRSLTISVGTMIEHAFGGDGRDFITGNAANNQLLGGRGADRFAGLDGADTIAGGAGSDRIDGGAGFDAAVFSGNRADYEISVRQNGEIDVVDRRSGSPDGADTLFDVDIMLFDDRPMAPVAQLADVLWRHDEGTPATAAFAYDFVPLSWEIQGAGDFDGDSDGDILWRHSEGMLVTWEIEDGAHHANHVVAFASSGWEIVDIGDFDNDQDSDVLWRHAEGAVVTWEMEEGTYVTNHNIAFASNGWRVDALGDFDGDGDSDIIWRHREGAVVTWEMEDQAYVVNHNIAVASNSWQIEGTGDFDGDGDDDIVWRHEEGAVVTWEMEGGEYVTNHNIAFAPNGWRIEGTGDFNRDGTDDILWRHVDGLVVTWEMEGGELLQTRNFGLVAPAWQITGTGQFDLA